MQLEQSRRFKRLVADLTLDNAVLKEATPEKLLSPSRRRKAVMWFCRLGDTSRVSRYILIST